MKIENLLPEKIDDFLPRKVVISLVSVAFLIMCFIFARHIISENGFEWLEKEVSEDTKNDPQSAYGTAEGSLFISPVNAGSVPNSTSVDPSGPKPRELTPNEVRRFEYEQASWRREHGYFTNEDHGQYASYSNDALLKLAQRGDLLALDILADKAHEAGQRNRAIQLRRFAALHGSTSALVDMAAMFGVRSWDNDLTAEQRKLSIRTMLVYSELAAMRGDRTAIWSSLIEINQESIKVTESDMALVSAEAKRWYADLKKQRENLGLDPFNNRTDPLTEHQLDYLLLAQPNPNGWATKFIDTPTPLLLTGS